MHQDTGVLMLSIKRFYGKPENVSHVVSIVQGTPDASLRMIEWFITNYAKKNDVILSRGGDQLNVYHSYRSALKTFSKEQFDPFRRHERIRFVYGYEEDEAIETTVGQLNFFKWAIETGVLDYIKTNKLSIEVEMVKSGAAKRTKSNPASVADRQKAPPATATATAPGTGTVHQKCQTTLSFD
jgi:hypothetical protein